VSLLRLILPAAAALAATVLAAGCGGAGGHGPAVATDHVSMAKSYRFDPDVIRIKAGDTVTWTNNDNFTHTVKVEGQDDHKVGRGDSFAIRFPKRGTFDYECTLHSHDMRGTVIVS
jgi:plastocyanin